MAILSQVLRGLGPGNWAGPIFAKELRVSSRRRRNYVLRLAYVLLMAIVVGAAWSAVELGGSAGAYQASRMAVVGHSVTAVIAWFQFWSMQVIAVVLCSTSISDEISRRTLGVLMTTPITSVQIVVGKMLSRLLQLFLLLAISLPMLAVIRVFGGVPWGYVISSTCITATATIFAAAVSMFFSVYSRHAYSVIMRSLLFGLCFSLVGPIAIGMMFPSPLTWTGLLLLNPTMMMALHTAPIGSPFGFSQSWNHWWVVHCGIMFGLSWLIMMWCAARVRKVALQEIIGSALNNPVPLAPPSEPRVTRRLPPVAVSAGPAGETAVAVVPAAAVSAEPADSGDYYRPIVGSPVTWRETRAPLIRGGRGVIMFLLLSMLLLLMYGLAGSHNSFDYGMSHALFLAIYLIIAIIDTCSLGGASIAGEREANTWMLLLTTPLSDWEIVRGKLIGIIRRSSPAWAFLLGHTLIFMLLGRITLVGAVLTTWICVYTAIFIGSMGVFFSSRLRKTGAAVATTLFMAAVIWLLLPTILPRHAVGGWQRWNPVFKANPVYQVAMVMDGAAGDGNMVFGMLDQPGADGLPDAAALLLICGLVYILIGGLLLAGACRNVRRVND